MGELLENFLREYKMILNEAEPVVGKDVDCAICRQPINIVIDAFFVCIKNDDSSSNSYFCMHKTCSELPPKFTHPMNPQNPLSLFPRPYRKQLFYSCHVCDGNSQGLIYVSNNDDFLVCLKCVKSEIKSLEDRNRCHPGHNHPLTLVQRPALFLCHACNTTATDLSYICTKCCFYIHKSCADAPITYSCRFHNEHSLILHYSLPKEYREYLWFCGICDKNINPIYWVYCCANCRFFALMKCASSTEMLRENEIIDEASNLMQFPVHDKASLHETMQKCIVKAAFLHNSAIVEPSPYLKHWGHEHQLALRSKNTKSSTLDLDLKLANTEWLICDGCTKSISLVNDIFYECNSCKFFFHRSCAQYPEKIEHHLAGKLEGVVVTQGVDKLALSRCRGCNIYGNGIFMVNETTRFDIGCASLPRIIKHEAHRHPLNQLKYPNYYFCKACFREDVEEKETIMYGCEKCEYYIHIRCVLRPHLVKHKWDPHPLKLILFVKNVADHPHEFECEFCSQQIDTNTWFYHCNVCDLSFHTHCIDPYNLLSNIKIGATNNYSDSHPHPHGLTFVLNKKKRRCNICSEDAWGLPVLECLPCKYIVHKHCFLY